MKDFFENFFLGSFGAIMLFGMPLLLVLGMFVGGMIDWFKAEPYVITVTSIIIFGGMGIIGTLFKSS